MISREILAIFINNMQEALAFLTETGIQHMVFYLWKNICAYV